MAFIANQSLDDEPAGDGDVSFIGGQISASQESSIPKNAFASAQNMDFDSFGRMETRRGARTTTGNVEGRAWEAITTNWNALTAFFSSSLGSAAIDACFYFDTYANEYVVIAQSGVLYQGTETSIYSSIVGSSYSGSSVFFAQLNNRLYYCDATGGLKYIDSALANSAITAGRVGSVTMTSVGAGYTSVPAITFSSGAAAATAVLGYGGRVISSNVITPSSGYSATTPPTISFAAAPAGGVTAAGRVNITQTPGKPQFLTAHRNRLFCASADTAIPPDTVYASDILDGESWDLAGSSIRVGGDGDPITGIYPWFENNLLIFKQRSIWVVDCNPLVDVANWTIRLVNNRIGCVAHRSIQAVGADVYFLSQIGVRTIGQIQAGTQTDVGQPISTPIQDQIEGTNNARLSTACSVYYGNRYMLAVPMGSATTPDTVLVWNELTKSWAGSWKGWAPRDFCVTSFSGRNRLNFADNTGKLWTWDDYTAPTAETTSQYQDDTNSYESFVVTRAYDFGDPLVDKLLHGVQVFTENRLTDSAVPMYLYYAKDISSTWTAIDTNINVLAGDRQKRRAYNLVSKGKANVVQFKFGATRWKASLPAIAVTAFSDTLNPEVNT